MFIPFKQLKSKIMKKHKFAKQILILLFAAFLILSGNLHLVLAQTPKPTLFAPGIVSSEFTDTTATFSPDGRTVYFVRSDVQENYNTILESNLKNGKWSEPKVVSFSGWWNDSEPCVSPDGNKLFFTSNRPVTAGGKTLTATFRNRIGTGKNIWYVEKKGDDWGEPVHIEGALAEYQMVYNPSVAKSGTLYFSGVLPDDPTKNQIYRSVLANGVYGKPERLSFSDIKWNHMDPSVDPDERFMVFAANRPGSLGGSADIYIVFQKNGVWGEPVSLGEDVNSSSLENAPVLAPDGKTLYFSSSRPAANIYPKNQRDDFAALTKRLHSTENGSRNIWQVDISSWIANGLK